MEYTNKSKNLNQSTDSTKTTDTITDPNDYETLSIQHEIEKEENANLTNFIYNDIEIRKDTSTQSPKEKDEYQFFLFKLYLSISFCIIYFFFFLLSIPKSPIICSEEKKINLLLKSNKTDSLNILMNRFSFINRNENNTTGYLIEFHYNKSYIFRWIIGFIYFIVRNIFFIFSEKINEKNSKNYFFSNKFDFVQKISYLFFPLIIFFYDVKQKEKYLMIKDEIIENKFVKYYIILENNFGMNNYVEGIIPTLFYFIISLIYKGIEQSFGKIVFFRNKNTKLG